MIWTAAAAALPVIVTVLVLAALTLAVLLFAADGFDALFAVVAVEWLVVNRVPLTVDGVELGFLPLLPPLLYVAILARQTRAVLSDVEQPGPREAGAAVTGVTLAGVLLTVLATLLVGSAASDFAVRESSLPSALLWTVLVGAVGAGLGVWSFFRRDLREVLPLWVRGGIHLGVAFLAATWAIVIALVLVGVVMAWEPVGSVLEIGKGFVGTAALTAISVAYLPNVVMAGSALVVGGEAHLGQASYSVFAVSRGPMPEVPLAAVLPTTTPHWAVQGLLLVTVLVAAGLARSVAHWFRTTADAVRATWLAAAIVAVVVALSPLVAGGQLGMLGMVGTGSLIAGTMSLLLFGIIGSATVALSLAGLTRRRERAESELERRRRRAGTVPEAAPVVAVGDDDEDIPAPGDDPTPAGDEVDPEAEEHPAPEEHLAPADDPGPDDVPDPDPVPGPVEDTVEDRAVDGDDGAVNGDDGAVDGDDNRGDGDDNRGDGDDDEDTPAPDGASPVDARTTPERSPGEESAAAADPPSSAEAEVPRRRPDAGSEHEDGLPDDGTGAAD